MKTTPIEIKRNDGKSLTLRWSDGTIADASGEKIRRACPCAFCRMERGEDTHSAPLTPAKKSLLKVIEHTASEQTTIKKVWGIGNYAIGIEWEDGHNDGIYNYDYLYEITAAN